MKPSDEVLAPKNNAVVTMMGDFIIINETSVAFTSNNAPCIEHVDTGIRCLVNHHDGVQCKQCSMCFTWYR
mgnify:CR=1 FL=1